MILLSFLIIIWGVHIDVLNYIDLIECVRCQAIKNKVKKYATDKVKKL